VNPIQLIDTIRSIRVPWVAHHETEDGQLITAAGLARLLARLDADTERAALEYERLRRALIKFFDWRGAWLPEECADEALDRLARKLDETIVEDVRNYAHGIARLVLLERRRQPVLSSIDGEVVLSSVQATPPDDENERLRDCFDRCLEDFPSDIRTLVLGYYQGERGDKISNRRQLAATLGLSDNALRSRVQRLRDRLERCVQTCVSAAR
jgi:DNA-directed RNA polymerase specialized sigma24 family protein